MLRHISTAIIPFGIGSPKGGCDRWKGNCGPVLCGQGHQLSCAGEAWRLPVSPLTKVPAVASNMQGPGQPRDLGLSARTLMEKNQNGHFLSTFYWTAQNIQKPHENSLKHYSSHLRLNQILFFEVIQMR